jgi:hypothetical protein
MEYINAPNVEETTMMEIRTYAHFANINIEQIVILVEKWLLAFWKGFAMIVDISQKYLKEIIAKNVNSAQMKH